MFTQVKQSFVFWFILLTLLAGCTNEQVQPSTSQCEQENLDWESRIDNSLLPVKLNGRWGFIDRSGKLVVKPQFASLDSLAPYFLENRAAVGGENGKWGFIDKAGKVIVGPKFQNVRSFQEQRAPIKFNGKWGFIDRNGNTIITPKFTDVSPFFEERAFVQVSYLWGVIDTNGNVIVEPKFASYTYFSKGFAVVPEGIVDRNGKLRALPWGIQASTEGAGFRSGLTPVYANRNPIFGDLFDSGQTYKQKIWGFVDSSGKVAISTTYDSVLGFEDCLAAVELEGKWGFINTKGEIIIQPQFRNIPRFSEGLADVKVNEKYGFIDTTGKMVIEPLFYEVRPFSSNLAAVRLNKSSGWGFINRIGKIVITPQFDTTYKFLDGIAQVEKNGKIGYIDKTGRYIWKPTN